MTKTQNYWKRLTATLWFIPTLLAFCGGLLGLIIVAVDYYAANLGFSPHFLDVQPSGARDMLAVVAGSMITVAGTVFSITIVALTLASTQFSPRILRNFMRDTGNQVVLGAFVGIFAYCIVVLRTIRENNADEGGNFVPSFAVAFGVAFGLSGIGFLIYFIHHVATTIQATSIISAIAQETVCEIEQNYSFKYEDNQYDSKTLSALKERKWIKIPSNETGYIQNADTHALFELAKKHDLIVQMRRRVGEFTIKGLPLLQISAVDADFNTDKMLIDNFNEAYDIGNFRTVEGDVAFGLRQIVDIALKALSPAINDTTTSLSCIDYLTAILISMAKRPSRPPLFYCEGKLRLVVNQQRFEDYFDLAFNQIRQNAAGNVAVILRLLNSIEILGKANQSFDVKYETAERHEMLENQARLLHELAERTISADSDLQAVVRHYHHVRETLEGLR
ncbi:MAG TPA: DUF2254 domain-containing protein [Pyrinomonadaceae bacterium]|nr:DUF2254 domain-containing protein [Pyrinomonadaceae bacterium]